MVYYLGDQFATERLNWFTITALLGDKGFDSRKNHELAEKYNAEFIAPIKNRERSRIYGYRRRMLARKFPSEIYHQRVIIESIFSAVKRRFGHELYARKFNAQKNELLFRFIAYDAEKLIKLEVMFFTFY